MADLFVSPTMTRVLGLISGASDPAITASEAARRLDANLESTQRAMHRLRDAGVLKSRRERREVHFSFDRTSSLFQPLRSLGLDVGSLGVGLRRAAQDLGGDAVQAAFIYGSVAEGRDTAKSDLDLFVVGEAPLHRLVPYFWDWGDRWGREVNPLVKPASVVSEALRDGRGFYKAVFGGPKIFVAGSSELLDTILQQMPHG